MPGRRFDFGAPDRFVAGAVGPPGRRTFYLQAAKGGAVLSVSLEKVQVAVLAQRIGELIDRLGRRGVAVREASGREQGPGFETPAVEAFRAGGFTVTYEDGNRQLTVEASEGEAEGGDRLVVRLTLEEARLFAQRALAVVAAGRPPCPLCGEPLDPQGHICLRRNGYVM